MIEFNLQQPEDIPSVTTIPSTPGCALKAADDDEVKTTRLTDALLAAFKIASVYAMTLVMTMLGSALSDTSVASKSVSHNPHCRINR